MSGGSPQRHTTRPATCWAPLSPQDRPKAGRQAVDRRPGSARHTARVLPHDPAARLAWQTEPPEGQVPGAGRSTKGRSFPVSPVQGPHSTSTSTVSPAPGRPQPTLNVEHGSLPCATSLSEPVCHLQEGMVLSSSGMFNALGPGSRQSRVVNRRSGWLGAQKGVGRPPALARTQRNCAQRSGHHVSMAHTVCQPQPWPRDGKG